MMCAVFLLELPSRSFDSSILKESLPKNNYCRQFADLWYFSVAFTEMLNEINYVFFDDLVNKKACFAESLRLH